MTSKYDSLDLSDEEYESLKALPKEKRIEILDKMLNAGKQVYPEPAGPHDVYGYESGKVNRPLTERLTDPEEWKAVGNKLMGEKDPNKIQGIGDTPSYAMALPIGALGAAGPLLEEASAGWRGRTALAGAASMNDESPLKSFLKGAALNAGMEGIMGALGGLGNSNLAQRGKEAKNVQAIEESGGLTDYAKNKAQPAVDYLEARAKGATTSLEDFVKGKKIEVQHPEMLRGNLPDKFMDVVEARRPTIYESVPSTPKAPIITEVPETQLGFDLGSKTPPPSYGHAPGEESLGNLSEQALSKHVQPELNIPEVIARPDTNAPVEMNAENILQAKRIGYPKSKFKGGVQPDEPSIAQKAIEGQKALYAKGLIDKAGGSGFQKAEADAVRNVRIARKLAEKDPIKFLTPKDFTTKKDLLTNLSKESGLGLDKTREAMILAKKAGNPSLIDYINPKQWLLGNNPSAVEMNLGNSLSKLGNVNPNTASTLLQQLRAATEENK